MTCGTTFLVPPPAGRYEDLVRQLECLIEQAEALDGSISPRLLRQAIRDPMSAPDPVQDEALRRIQEGAQA